MEEKKQMMDLTKLVESRGPQEIKPLPICDKELVDRYEQVTTPMVNDVLRERTLVYQTLPNNIMPLRDNMRVAGIAFTIKGAKSLITTFEMKERAEMLESLLPDSLVVWDTSGDTESAQWGEVMTMAAIKRGCRGAVVDGGVRDTDRVLEQGFPVFVKYRSSNGMLGRFRISGWQLPIRIGEVIIYPGDVVLADLDGVIVVPRDIAYEVLLRAEQIRNNESEIKKWVRDGLTPAEIVDRGGYF